MSGTAVAKQLGISPQHYYDIERGENRLSAENAVLLAEIFEVSLDYLLGQSAKALIEDALERTGMTLSELSERANVSIGFLANIDLLSPYPGDDEAIDSVAEVLNIEPGDLFNAYFGLEQPVYTSQGHSVADDFTDEDVKGVELVNEYLRLRSKPTKQNREVPNWATSKDIRDFKKMLEDDAPVMFDGVPIEGEARQRVMDILTGLFWEAKEMNKTTYGRKKKKSDSADKE